MSSTITLPLPIERDDRPQYSAERTIPLVPRPAADNGRARSKRVTHKASHGKVCRKISFKRRVEKAIKHFEQWMHYSIAAVLSAITVATMAYTTVTLLTTSRSFAAATSNAVAGVLIVLILIEITRTVITEPDGKGVAIRRLLMIAIMSALREVLWIGVNGDGSQSTGLDKPLAMAIGTVVVVGLAAAYMLVRHASDEKRS